MKRQERLNDNEEALREAFDGTQYNIYTSMPGLIVAVNLGANTLTVQPAITARTKIPAIDNSNQILQNTVPLPLLINVPIVWPTGGGFSLTFPLVEGDEVLVVWAKHCIDGWWQNGGIANQIEYRLHDISDGFALVGVTSQPRIISSISSSSVQLRSNDGMNFLEVTNAGEINVTAATAITLTAPQINLNGSITQTDGSFTIDSIPFGTHKHTGVQTGGSETGGPTS